MQTCECGVVCDNKFNLDRHKLTRSHELNILCGESLVSNENGIYECKLCNYHSARKENFRRHVVSLKHKQHKIQNSPTQVETSSAIAAVNHVSPVTLTEVMEMFMKHSEMFIKHQENTQIQNTEMFKTLADRIVVSSSQTTLQNNANNTTNNANNNNTTTTTNKKFNLNFFLNEECKNAMNLSDFIEQLAVNMEDLEYICEVGYTQGMSKIISKAINEKRKTERPIHCSDPKRETMYVRKDDAWQKDPNKDECQRLIDQIVSKNYKCMKKWCDDHPNYQVSDSPDYEKWYSITRKICNADPRAMKKLIHHLALATEIEKSEADDGEESD